LPEVTLHSSQWEWNIIPLHASGIMTVSLNNLFLTRETWRV
jgi:hypothetical protein